MQGEAEADLLEAMVEEECEAGERLLERLASEDALPAMGEVVCSYVDALRALLDDAQSGRWSPCCHDRY